MRVSQAITSAKNRLKLRKEPAGNTPHAKDFRLSLDRFSRDKYDSVIYKCKLRTKVVKIISVVENLDDSPESIMPESVIEGMAQYYSKNLAREVMKGLRESAYDCKHLDGIPPLGYDVDPSTQKYVINESEANIVRLIFEKYLSGWGYKRIL